MATRKSRRTGHTGAVWSETDYEAAGYGRLTLRVKREVLDALDELREALREPGAKDLPSRAAVIARLILEKLERL